MVLLLSKKRCKSSPVSSDNRQQTWAIKSVPVWGVIKLIIHFTIPYNNTEGCNWSNQNIVLRMWSGADVRMCMAVKIMQQQTVAFDFRKYRNCALFCVKFI